MFDVPDADRAFVEQATGVERRVERAVFETDRHRIVGDVTLPPEGYRSRFSDLLNRGDFDFIHLVNVEMAPLGGGEGATYPFVALAKAHIRVAFPLDDGQA